MSRWEALKEDTRSKASRSSNKHEGNGPRRNHDTNNNKRSYQPYRNSSRNNHHRPADDDLYKSLKKQLSLYKANSDEYQKSTVLKSLDEFLECFKTSSRKEINTETFMLIMDLLSIEDIDDVGFYNLLIDRLKRFD